jgi:cyclomaltodextrinase / maltogenic alpha-amylase / neopullulanase
MVLEASHKVDEQIERIPGWLTGAVFYQIFPDRFANGDEANDPSNVQSWSNLPSLYSYFGGDLRGIQRKLDYIQDLGANTIYLNPIFQSAAPHRYHTTDYYRIDPKLGTMEDLRALLDDVHGRGMRLILDGVFNHCGRGFFAFNDLLENQQHSPYKDWFHVKRFPIDAFSPGEAEDYLAWWNIKSLPKFNTDNPEVRQYLLGVARYWIEQGIDGWRLDVPNEIDDDVFWADFRRVVREANPEAALIGEIWEIDPRWVGSGHFDGLMNYPVRDAVLDLLKWRNGITQFVDRIEHVMSAYPWEHILVMYNTLGTHDTKRVRTYLDGDLNRVALAFTFLTAYPGLPAFYYGDEVGLEGDKDPDSRRTFPWDENDWAMGLRDLVKKLIRLRKASKAIQTGDYQRVWVDEGQRGYAFARQAGDETVLVALNASDKPMQAEVPVDVVGWKDGSVKDLIHGGNYEIEGGRLRIELASYDGVWLAR